MMRLPPLTLALALALAAGCAPAPKPLYCKLCAPIKALEAKAGRTAADEQELVRLKADAYDKLGGRATVAEFLGGKEPPPDLHPGCDCDCHRWFRDRSGRR